MQRPWFNGGRVLRYLWPLRVPIVSAVLLAWWPFLSFYDGVRPYLGGLFDPVDPRAIVLITVLALMNAWTILIIACLIVSYGHERMGLPQWRCIVPTRTLHWIGACAVASSLAVPLIWTLGKLVAAGATSSAHVMALIAGGVVAASALFALAAGIHVILSHPARLRSVGSYVPLPRFVLVFVWTVLRGVVRATVRPVVRRFIRVLQKFPALGEGFLDTNNRNRLAPGHTQAFGLSVASVAAYVATGFMTSDIHRPVLASTLAYVLLLQLMLTWLAGIAAFMLDRSRAPLFVYAMMFMAGVNWLIHPFASTDHVYRTSPLHVGTVPDRITPTALLGGQPVSIVVAASGGGIQSAAWTARVLTGLQDAVPEFRSRVRLISSVSGGSVGTMNVLASWPGCGPALTEEEKARPVGFDANVASRESSLHAVGWGLVFKDLPRTVAPYFSSPEVDRGSVLEDAWKREPRLQRRYPDDPAAAWIGPPLSWWRTNVAEHLCPAVVYNAMVAETGEPMLFATVDLPRSLSAFDFYKHYPARDLPMTTAARLSAGFPYVSPASRADADTDRYSHVVDGGYFDNYGIVSLAGIVHEALESATLSPLRQLRVLVIEICDTPECSGKESNGTVTAGGPDDRSWTYQLTAPLSAVMQMRSSAQRVNNRESLRLLKAHWLMRGACIESVEASFAGENAPMSWHLTAKEKEEVDRQWAAESSAVVQGVRDFLARANEVGLGGATSPRCVQ